MIGIGEGHILGLWKGTGIAESLSEIPLIPVPTPPVIVPPMGVANRQRFRPGRGPGRLNTRSRLVGGSTFPVLTIPARGPAISQTFTITPEDGYQVTYSWSTRVLEARKGTEHRIARVLTPRETYDFQGYIQNTQLGAIQSSVVVDAALGHVFGVALEHESALITVDGPSATFVTIDANQMALIDWAYPGSTVMVVSPDGETSTTFVVQSVTATTFKAVAAVGATNLAGGRIMPVIPCYLNDTQTFAHSPINASLYSVSARAAIYGNALGAWAPNGSTVTLYTDPFTFQTYPVWDRRVAVESTTPRGVVAGTEITDFGGQLFMTSRRPIADFVRQIVFTERSDADRQYLKTFGGLVNGMQKVFMLPTWKPDLVPIGDASTSVLRFTGGVGGFDFVNKWSKGQAQLHLQLYKSDGTVAYVAIDDWADNFDGTQSVQLDRAVTGALSRVSFLETCRFTTDDFVVKYMAGGYGKCTLPLQVVQQ